MFEELLLVSSRDADGRTATTSVRDLAARTGLAKDTVAHALTRLRRAGAITAHQARVGGSFAAGSYRLSIPAGIDVVEPTATEPPSEQSLGVNSDGACVLPIAVQPGLAALPPVSPASVAAPAALPAGQLAFAVDGRGAVASEVLFECVQ